MLVWYELGSTSPSDYSRNERWKSSWLVTSKERERRARRWGAYPIACFWESFFRHFSLSSYCIPVASDTGVTIMYVVIFKIYLGNLVLFYTHVTVHCTCTYAFMNDPLSLFSTPWAHSSCWNTLDEVWKSKLFRYIFYIYTCIHNVSCKTWEKGDPLY